MRGFAWFGAPFLGTKKELRSRLTPANIATVEQDKLFADEVVTEKRLDMKAAHQRHVPGGALLCL